MTSPVLGLRPWRAWLSFTLNLQNPGRLTPQRLFCRLKDAGEYGINGLFGRAFLKASLVRHIINQVHQFHAARSPEGGGERAWDEASVIRFVQMSPSRMRGALLQPA